MTELEVFVWDIDKEESFATFVMDCLKLFFSILNG